ncbi:long-chain fatty acid transport protein [Archangium gephyra]|uniref:Long-chain fatty acid transport protein n=1 Tax=Archangium gephyra TaxID=48 RepID=A0AAC8QIJ5_9BACT|nr:outer membrane protein transport protein [Archangium gephyra]AKJ08198.1 Long-chain fatty acid transport protein [Archangium gephyra]REG29930.1 long-chain fatty acid transport protein [Archangium gephyra]
MKKTLTVVTLLAAGASQAAGLAIDTQGSRATGMGSTGVASMRDASSIYYNPAGILGVNKLDIQLGDSLILGHLSFTPQGSDVEQTQDPSSPPPHGYLVYKITDQLAAGVGVFTPFGAKSKWPEDFVGRQIARESQVATFDINPTVAFAPLSWLRLGVGFQAVYGTLDASRQTPGGTGELALSTSTWGMGYNAGVQADLLPGMLTLGAHFRSRVLMFLEGDADFSGPVSAAIPDQPVRLDVELPASLGLGVAFTPMQKLLLAADVNWVKWSSVQQLLFEFETTPTLNQPSVKNWEDRWNFHVGGEYMVTDALAVRAGFVYDPTPSPAATLAPDLPDADRIRVSLGAGYAFSSFHVDAGYQFVSFMENESTFSPLPGTYKGSAHVIGLTLGYSP